MPIGGPIRPRTLLRAPPKPEPKPAPPKSGLVKIKRPPRRPVRILVQPPPRHGVKQFTVLRYDNEGQYYVDEFVERLGLGGIPEDRRHIRHVSCPRFQFSVALAVCHRYCAFPCRTHLEAIQSSGWYKPGGFHDESPRKTEGNVARNPRRR